MDINIAKSAGFCSGVKRAINIALDTVAKGQKVCMLGDIVHNEDVVRQIKDSGIAKIRRLANAKGKTLIIRAHGAAIKTFQNAKKRGYKIIDATCPMVKEIHRIACNMENDGRKIIVIGDKKHDEVLGIIGQLKHRALVIDKLDSIPMREIKKIKRGGVVVQSTQNSDKVLSILKVLKEEVGYLLFFNTICRPTRLKQEEIKLLPANNDLMIIIGSKNSANTQRLYEISKSINKRSYWVNSENDIKKGWFKNAKKVGVTAGASTPEETIRRITEKILSIG
jgi:4-hydroxy-3-methylbut-2-en-1-yl diphosphate reductase